jgi:hypothetical protein
MDSGAVVSINRTIQLVFAIIVLSLAAALVANQPSIGGDPGQAGFSLFIGVFSLVTFPFIIWLEQVEHRLTTTIALVLNLLNGAFYGGQGIAMVANQMNNNLDIIAAGSSQRRHEARTLTVFLWFGITLSPS